MSVSATEILTTNEIAAAKEGTVLLCQLQDLHPAQAVLGYDEVFYKLGRYAKDRDKLFRDICEINGQDELVKLGEHSDPRNPTTFVCKDPIGTNRREMKTVVVAPNNEIYLTDGHHSFTAFLHMKEGGPDFPVHVVVTKDYRNVSSMAEFWHQMEADGNVWLFDVSDKKISAPDLPRSLGLDYFVNDPYRGLMYLTNEVAWDKPEYMTNPKTGKPYPIVPFVEFYWGRELRKVIDPADYDLTKRDGYQKAIHAVSEAILNVRSTNVGGSGKTAKEMGKYDHINPKKLAKVVQPPNDKLSYLLECMKKWK